MAQEKVNIIVTTEDQASAGLSRIKGGLVAMAAAAGAAAIAIGVDAVKKAAAFETQMSNISTLLGEGVQASDELKNGIRELIRTMPVDPDELGASAYDIFSAGITDTSKALEVLKESAKLANAGLGDVSQSTDLMTTAINAFASEGLTAAEVSNLLFETVKNGKTTVADLASSFGKMAGNAAAAGVSFYDVQAATAALTTVTGQTSESQNALAQVFLELTVAGGKLDKALQDNGSSLAELNTAIGDSGLVGGFQKLQGDLGLTETEFKNMFSSAEGGNAVFQLLTSANGAYTSSLSQMTDGVNILDEANSKQNETYQKQLDLLKNNLHDAMITIGLELLPQLTVAFGELTIWMNDNQETVKTLAQFFGVVLSASLGLTAEMLKWVSHLINLLTFSMGKDLTGSVKGVMILWDLFREKTDGIIGVINRVIHAISSLISKLRALKNEGGGGGFLSGVKSALGFSRGGIVPKYYAGGGFVSRGTDTIPAMLTPGEVVLNAAQQRNLAGSMGGVTINITGTFLSEDAAERVGDMIVRRFQQHALI